MRKKEWRLLNAYKATGLTPEQVADMKSGTELRPVVLCEQCRSWVADEKGQTGICYTRGFGSGVKTRRDGYCDRGCR